MSVPNLDTFLGATQGNQALCSPRAGVEGVGGSSRTDFLDLNLENSEVQHSSPDDNIDFLPSGVGGQ